MRLEDLQYHYPEELVATHPQKPSRIAFLHPCGQREEIQKDRLFSMFSPGDVLVVNDTKVEKRRVFSGSTEILFVRALSDLEWEVLFPAREVKVGDSQGLPGGLTMTLRQKGLPQVVSLSRPLDAAYFHEFGEPALPPYIQKARGERHARPEDHEWYQTKWAQPLGSSAAPTASLHFTEDDLAHLESKGVHVVTVTLHVGLGTFLPIKVPTLDEHVMHEEWVSIPFGAQQTILKAKEAGRLIWALGTTVTRALESWGQGLLPEQPNGDLMGGTRLFIRPGFEFKIVSVLLTNFHQPGSTLLALVAAFAGLDRVKQTYAWAIENRFRLFSYGDLSIWTR